MSTEPITDHVHNDSWSANLEKPHHADDSALVIGQTINAINHASSGNHANPVTHGNHGHPREYLFEALADEYGDDIEWSTSNSVAVVATSPVSMTD